MRILVTNDDGVDAHGLKALHRVLAQEFSVVVCAPAHNCSATSHKLTLDRPVRWREVAPGVYAVDGTPVDSVVVALQVLLPDPPDAVICGINHGPNLGQDVFYSGTVAAALEAGMNGLPAAAISATSPQDGAFQEAAEVGRWLCRFLTSGEVPQGVVLNVNVPPHPRGMRLCRLGKRVYRDFVALEGTTDDPACRIGGGVAEWEDDEQSDHAAVAASYVSVTPLGQDLTRTDLLETLRLPPSLP